MFTNTFPSNFINQSAAARKCVYVSLRSHIYLQTLWRFILNLSFLVTLQVVKKSKVDSSGRAKNCFSFKKLINNFYRDNNLKEIIIRQQRILFLLFFNPQFVSYQTAATPIKYEKKCQSNVIHKNWTIFLRKIFNKSIRINWKCNLVYCCRSNRTDDIPICKKNRTTNSHII